MPLQLYLRPSAHLNPDTGLSEYTAYELCGHDSLDGNEIVLMSLEPHTEDDSRLIAVNHQTVTVEWADHVVTNEFGCLMVLHEIPEEECSCGTNHDEWVPEAGTVSTDLNLIGKDPDSQEETVYLRTAEAKRIQAAVQRFASDVGDILKAKPINLGVGLRIESRSGGPVVVVDDEHRT